MPPPPQLPDATVLLTDNADRPYADERRAALLRLLLDEGDYELLAATRSTRVRMATRQGAEFEIARCELRRRRIK